MADTDHSIQQLTRAITDLNARMGGFGRMYERAAREQNRSSNERNDRERNDWSDMHRRVSKGWDLALGAVGATATGAAGALKGLTRSSNSAADAFIGLSKILLGGAIGGALIGTMTDYTVGLNKTFQNLSDQGKNFSGDVFNMAQAAASAGLTLEEYARINKQFSQVAARMAGTGAGSLGAFAKGVRSASHEFGMFGMTIEGLNDLTGTYAETMRIQGRLNELATGQGQSALVKMAGEATALSQLLGTNRKQTIENATQAMKEEAYATRLSLMNDRDRQRYGEAFNSAIAGFAAQAGEAGKMLSNMFAQTAAYDGRAYNTDAARDLFNNVLPEATTIMEDTYAKVKADGANALFYQNQNIHQLKKIVEANKENLLTMAESTGPYREQARRILRMYNELGDVPELTKEMARVQQEYKENLTQMLGSMEDAWNNLKTGILSKFLPLIAGPVRAFATAIMKYAESDSFKTLMAGAETAGKTLETLIKDTLTPERLGAMATMIQKAVTAVSDFVAGLLKADTKEMTKNIVQAWDKASAIFSTLGTIASAVGSALMFMKEHIVGVTAAVVGLYALKKAFDAASWFKGLREMTVTAATVNVNGRSLGGRGGAAGGNDRHNNRRGGRAGRAWGAMRGPLGWIGAGAGVLAGAGALDYFTRSTNSAAEAQERAAEAATAAAAATEQLGEPLDDLRRGVLDNKARKGTLTEAEKIERDKDIELRRKRREAAAGAAQPVTPPAEQPPAPATPTSPSNPESPAAQTAAAVADATAAAAAPLGAVVGKVGGMLEQMGGQGGVLSKIAPAVKGVAKALPFIGAGASVLLGGYDAYQLKQAKDRGEISEEEYRRELTKTAVNAGVDTVAALIPGPVGLALKALALSNNGSDMLGLNTFGDGVNAVAATGGGAFGHAISAATTAATTAVASLTGNRSNEQANLEQRVQQLQDRLNERTAPGVPAGDSAAHQIREMRQEIKEMLGVLIAKTDEVVEATRRSGSTVTRAVNTSGN